VRILALSDEVVERLYGPDVKQVVGNVDLVLGCGDVPHYYLEFVVTMLGVPLYYVPGNHDRMEQVLADGRTVTEPQGCVNLDHHLAREHDLLLAGLGGSIRYKPTGLHQYTEAEMSWRAWQMAPALWWNRVTHGRDLDILVTHSPPKSVVDVSSRGASLGSLAVRETIDRVTRAISDRRTVAGARATRGAGARASVRGGDDGQAEAAEILVEREARHVFEQAGDDDERDGVAEREPVIATVPSKDSGLSAG